MYHIMKYVLYIISVFFLITACKREKIEVNPSQEEEKKEIISEDSLIAADRIFYRDSLKFVNIYLIYISHILHLIVFFYNI